MFTRIPWRIRVLPARACLAALMWTGCQQPDEEPILRLTLNDTLNRYDSIQIALLRVTDSSVISIPFTGPLDSLKPIPLPSGLRDGQFIVRVRAYEFEGQIGVETYISKQTGQQVVTRMPLTPPRPYSAALKSIDFSMGILQPLFNPDMLQYEVLIPLNIDSVKITPVDSDSRAAILIDSVPFVADNTVYKQVALDSVVPVRITVRNHGHERIYAIQLRRDSRAGPHLQSFITEPGGWTPVFNPDSLAYALSVNDTIDSLIFDTLQADTGVGVFLNDTVVAAGSLPFTKSLNQGANGFTVKLSRSDGAEQRYNFIVTRLPPDTTTTP